MPDKPPSPPSLRNPRTVSAAPYLTGSVALPADKSIAQRTALFAALGDGRSTIANYPLSADPRSTLACLRKLGVQIQEDEPGLLSVQGGGLEGLRAPNGPLDCGNSGTTMRLLAGILAGQTFSSTLIGDASLSSRPMARIADPLRAMGAVLDLEDGHAPLRIRGNASLQGIEYRLPVPSAQIKSCLLLAGLYAAGETTVIETIPSRDHTERMLGLDVFEMGGARYLTVQHGHRIPARAWTVPRDFSAAAFFLVAATLVPEGEVFLPGVGLNASRSGLLDVLRVMGADITVEYEREEGGEPLADLTVRPAPLHSVSIGGTLIPNLIDEIPVLAVAAACAEGRTEIRDAAELRVKETDRIDAMARNLRALGTEVEAFEDGLAVTGGAALRGTTVDSFGDHRIAMAMGVAGLVASGETTITDADVADVSFPGFWDVLKRLTGGG